MSEVKFTPVYRQKTQGDKPRLGLPDGIQAGDYLTVFISGAYYTRRCLSAHKGYVLTEPLRWNGQMLDSSRKIPWEDIDDAARPPEGFQEPTASQHEPKPAPVPKPPKPAPVVPPAPPKKAPEPPPAPKPPEKPKPPEPAPKEPAPESLADLWSLLD